MQTIFLGLVYTANVNGQGRSLRLLLSLETEEAGAGGQVSQQGLVPCSQPVSPPARRAGSIPAALGDSRHGHAAPAHSGGQDCHQGTTLAARQCGYLGDMLLSPLWPCSSVWLVQM